MKKTKWYIRILAVAVIAVALTGCGKKIKLMDYYDVKITGIDGKGKATLVTNSSALEQDIIDAAKIDIKDLISLVELAQYMDGISVNLEPSEDLKNGDTVLLTVDYKGGEKDKVKLIGGEKKIKVSDLEKGKEIDLFKDIEVDFVGVAPNATVEIINNSTDPFVKKINFSATPNSGLKVGDKVMVTANYSEEEALEHKYLIQTKEKEYTVEKVDEYITAYSDLDAETVKNMKKEAQDLVDAYLVKNKHNILYDITKEFFSNSDNFNTETYLMQGTFFNLKNRDNVGSYGTNANNMVLFYKVLVTTSTHKDKSPIFLAVSFPNTIKRDDGKVDMVFSDGVVVRRELRMDDMIREIITANKDRYTVEDINYDKDK